MKHSLKIVRTNNGLWGFIGKFFLSLSIVCFLPYSLFSEHTLNNEISNKSLKVSQNMMIRIAYIEVYPEYLAEYIAILKENAEASVRLEPGVIAIYPMFEKENQTQIRILEIYLNQEAYETHLQTAHFKSYKTTTLPMIKSLQLIDMQAIVQETMRKIFNKIK